MKALLTPIAPLKKKNNENRNWN
jgi:hypothetical protein